MKMNLFGEQKNCLLDTFKPYQRPKLSDPAHGRQRLQPRRSRRVRCSAWLGRRRSCSDHDGTVAVLAIDIPPTIPKMNDSVACTTVAPKHHVSNAISAGKDFKAISRGNIISPNLLIRSDENGEVRRSDA